MTEQDARKLRAQDQVTWSWETAGEARAMPGTVTGHDQHGVLIFWQDSFDIPTHYAYDDDDAWPNIDRHLAERTYHPIPYNGALKRKRKKARK